MKNIFKNKTVLITGGTGFIGKTLLKYILDKNPHAVRVFSRDEVKHHLLQEEFAEFCRGNDRKLRCLVGDVRDYERLKKATQGCDIVIHAAAMKRIDMIEYNVAESIKTNVIGTLNVINSCLENNVEKVLYVSSDKACSPINTYGACKFISERIFIESNFSKGAAKTVFSIVRYGNVLESTGSLIPTIINKIKNNSDLFLTDPRMTRFFITKEQAIDLIFNALDSGVGGEIFVPKINSFKVVDVLELLKENYGSQRKIRVVGIRPGEKIHELMINKDESRRTFEFGNTFVIASEIEKWHRRITYDYLKNKKSFPFDEYNSKDFVIPKDELRKKLKVCGIIN